jgi:predicted alpha/beta superfamily hydrolase
MKKLFTSILLAISLTGYSQFPTVDIPGSQVRKITSSTVPNQEYVLQVMLPAGYDKSNKKYPVLYLQDSQWDFPLISALYGQQYFDGFIPEMIIVGITWGGTNPNPDSLRARDYTPTKEAQTPQSGGAAKYLSFIKNEAIPFVEANYRADKNDRTLMGCSLGGLFTLYAMFTEPTLFQRYVAATPAIGWDNEVIYKYEKQYFNGKPSATAKLFICEGGVERGVPAYEKFIKQLSQRNYKQLQYKSRIVENIGHSGTKGEGYERGLQYVFERPTFNASTALLQKYVGTYELPNKNTVEVKLENNQLVVYLSPNNKYTLHAATETNFYSTAEFLNVRFDVDASDKTTGLHVEGYGSTQTARKVK